MSVYVRTRMMLVLTVALATAVVAAACGGSSDDSSSPGNASDGVATVKAASNTTTKSDSLCARIPIADVQALLPSVPTTTAILDDCTYRLSDGIDLKVEQYPNDTDDKFYQNLSNPATDHQLSGVGDKAYWNEAVEGRTPPYVVAKKGTLTCVIQSNDPPDTTLKTTSSAGGQIYMVDDADALAYSQLMGKVCNDVLAGG